MKQENFLFRLKIRQTSDDIMGPLKSYGAVSPQELALLSQAPDLCLRPFGEVP